MTPFNWKVRSGATSAGCGRRHARHIARIARRRVHAHLEGRLAGEQLRRSLFEDHLAGDRRARGRHDDDAFDVGVDGQRQDRHLAGVAVAIRARAAGRGPPAGSFRAECSASGSARSRRSRSRRCWSRRCQALLTSDPLMRHDDRPCESVMVPEIRNRRPDTMRISTPGVSPPARARTRCADASSGVPGKYVVRKPILSSSLSGGAFGWTNVGPRASATTM